MKSFPGYRIAQFGTLLTFCVILLGAFTRLVDAGLGCPDWPTCYGHLWVPNTAEEIQQANEKFADTPVETDKTWPEQIHRIFASMLGLVVLCLTFICWRKSNEGLDMPLGQALFMTVFVILQGLFGMWTVTLKLWPQVVTAHLLGGFTMLALFWLMTLRLSNSVQYALLPKYLWRLSCVVMVIVIAQIALGGWTSSNYAALACTELPTCHGSWWPAMDLAKGFNLFQEIGPNYLYGVLDSDARTAIHVMHRAGAIATVCAVILLALHMMPHATLNGLASVILIVLAGQVALGVSNVLYSLPLAVAVAHNAVGALLLLTIVTAMYRIYRGTKHMG